MTKSKPKELELRILDIKIKDDARKLKKVADFIIGEGDEFEIKLISVISDGIANETFNVELGHFIVKRSLNSEELLKEFRPFGFRLYRNQDGKRSEYPC